jgi:hypothetical protein
MSREKIHKWEYCKGKLRRKKKLEAAKKEVDPDLNLLLSGNQRAGIKPGKANNVFKQEKGEIPHFRRQRERRKNRMLKDLCFKEKKGR